MKRSRVTTGTVLLATIVGSVASAAALRAATRIDHEAECTYKKLTWDDFRGPIVNGQQVSWISATIVLEPVRVDMVETEGRGTVARALDPIVYALMNKLASGAQRGGRTDENLAHEQIHFDLIEYVARRLWRELRELEVVGEARSEPLRQRFLIEAETRYKAAFEEGQRLHDQYDSETGNGTRSGRQRKWARKAESLLSSEPPYELR